MAKLKLTVGPAVDGDDRFWNREKELELFIESLDQGQNLLLVAPRRIGKTSLMHRAARLIADRYTCLQVDLQDSMNPADAMTRLSLATRENRSLWEKTAGIFANVLHQIIDHIDEVQLSEVGVKLRSGLTEGDWQDKGSQLFEALAAHDKPVVVFLDEIPILVNRLLKGDDYQITPERRRQADAFMSWLREISIRHRDKVRLVLTGSIGLEPVLRQAGLSATINAFKPFPLEAWSAETAGGCVQALANEADLDFAPEAIQGLVDHLGYCIPHHVQMFFDHIYQACHERDQKEVTAQLVAEVYNQQMLGIRGHAELSHMEERLKMVLGPELYLLALDLLTEASSVGRLTPAAARVLGASYESDSLREILNVLEHDGYLKQEAEGFVFVSHLLRDWWQKRFGFMYTPVSQRQGG